MATQPHPQPKPPTPPPPPPKPPHPSPEAAKTAHAADPALPIGAKPLDPKDPQAVKHDPPQPAPPRWDAKTPEAKPHEAFTPKPALDPHAEKPPQGAYMDGMTIADEQRARAAWVEAHGLEAYDEATDQRPADEKPKFDPHALAGGGAFVSAGTQKQVPGVVPPTKRE
jgi:hypothetical protein